MMYIGMNEIFWHFSISKLRPGHHLISNRCCHVDCSFRNINFGLGSTWCGLFFIRRVHDVHDGSESHFFSHTFRDYTIFETNLKRFLLDVLNLILTLSLTCCFGSVLCYCYGLNVASEFRQLGCRHRVPRRSIWSWCVITSLWIFI